MIYSNYNFESKKPNDYKRIVFSFKNSSALSKIIYINIFIFLISIIFFIPCSLIGYSKEAYYDLLLGFLGVPADIDNLVYRPWTIISYMFTHFNFLHILFNMLWLKWFGNMFIRHFNNKQLIGLYMFGGILGAIFYILSFNIFPFFSPITKINSWTIGASASVIAITLAVCTYLPKQNIYIFFIGPVKLIYIACFIVLIDILSIKTNNPGGHIAHLGGALAGLLFTVAIRKNLDITKWLNFFYTPRNNQDFKSHSDIKFSSNDDKSKNDRKKEKQIKINNILDKISDRGYDSLTPEEKEILFKADENQFS